MRHLVFFVVLLVFVTTWTWTSVLFSATAESFKHAANSADVAKGGPPGAGNVRNPAPARATQAQLPLPAPAPPVCPLVYVYNHSALNPSALFAQGFGRPLYWESHISQQLYQAKYQWLMDTEQHGLGSILLWRLLQSPSCMTDEASKAQIFVVPVRSEVQNTADEMANPNRTYTVMAMSKQNALRSLCLSFLDVDWRSALPHLSAANVHQHVIIHETEFSMVGFCNYFAEYRARTESARNALLMSAIQKVGTSADGIPNFISLALPSCVHLAQGQQANRPAGGTGGGDSNRDDAPWRPGYLARDGFRRDVLMMFGGSHHGSPFASRLRKHVAAKCAEYGPARCRLVTGGNLEAENKVNVALEAKMSATFCLEPPGFGPERKAMMDAIQLGCIPVLFHERESDDFRLWPHHWPADMKAETRVALPAKDVLSGRLDILEALSAISTSRVAAMQRAIAQHGFRLHYAQYNATDDGFHVALAAMAREATIARQESIRLEGSNSVYAKLEQAWVT